MEAAEKIPTSETDDMKPVGCIIMASGLGVRFGGNKLLTDFAGKPLLQWILDTTQGCFPFRVVVTRHPEVAELCRKQGIQSILHSLPEQSDTIRIGLQALKNHVSSVMFFPGDQPLLKRSTILSFLQVSRDHDQDILRACSSKGEGSPVLFPSWAFPELLELPTGKTGREIIRRYPDRIRLVQAESWELLDIDTQEQKDALEHLLTSITLYK